MTHILVKSGRVIVQGGKVLTSQGGAPCCCGPSSPCITCAQVTLSGVTAAEACGNLTMVLVRGLNENPVRAADPAFDGISCFLRSRGDFGNGFQSLASPMTVHYRDSFGTNYYSAYLSVAELYVWPSVDNRVRISRLRVTAHPLPGGALNGAPNVFWYDEAIDNIPRFTDEPLPNNAIDDPCVRSRFNLFSGGVAIVTASSNCLAESDSLILVACDGSGDEIAVDPDTQTGIGALYMNRLWIPDRLGSGDPVEVEWVNESCPDDPNTDDVYRINICGSTTRAGGGVVEGGVLTPKVIGYRPGTGLAPGEGMVWANIPVATGSGNVCLRRVACQPTTQVVTDAEIEYTSVAGNCRGQPVYNADPRPGCSLDSGPGGTDAGGGVEPSDTLGLNAPQDPALQAELDRQAMMRTGQFPGRCPSCGG